jgi:hypothetical protein
MALAALLVWWRVGSLSRRHWNASSFSPALGSVHTDALEKALPVVQRPGRAVPTRSVRKTGANTSRWAGALASGDVRPYEQSASPPLDAHPGSMARWR